MITTIVDARPDHARFVAWVILTAFRAHRPLGLWDFMIDAADEPKTLRYLEALTTSAAPHWAHHSIFRVAEVDGTPAAALSGYFDEELGMPAFQKGAAEADQRVGRSAAERNAAVQRIAPIFQVAPQHPTGRWIIESVATHPDYRRRGLVDALLAEILERGRERGAAHAGIGVMIGNDRAQRAYEKAGFRVFSERRDPDFERIWGCPGIRALSRAL
jgi:ribosomal protein S18 acetylase RimI-like enzyme